MNKRQNAYFCRKCKKATITIDVHEGTTPMFISCPSCGGDAISFMYQLPRILLMEEPEYEWYMPDVNETNVLSNQEKEHVLNGGLLLRKRTKI